MLVKGIPGLLLTFVWVSLLSDCGLVLVMPSTGKFLVLVMPHRVKNMVNTRSGNGLVPVGTTHHSISKNTSQMMWF